MKSGASPWLSEGRWRWGQRLGCLLVVLPLLILLPQVLGSTDRVRLRNALVLDESVNPAVDWPAGAPPRSFKREQTPASPVFVEQVRKLGLAELPGPWERSLAIASHLLSSAPVLTGGPIQSDLQRTYQRIVQDGEGYCGDFVRSFMALAHAAQIPTRSWGFAFDGFGGHGHIWVEIWNEPLARWQLLDVFNNVYFSRGHGPLSAHEVRAALLARDAELRMVPIEPKARPGYVEEAKAWEYYHRGETQWFQWLGDNLESYDHEPAVRLTGAISRSMEQFAAIATGVYPGMAIWPMAESRAAHERLRRLKTLLPMLGLSLVLGLGVLIISSWRLRALRPALQQWAQERGHVLVVGPLPPPAGGMANQCEQLLRLLKAEGVSVRLLRNNSPYRPAWTGRIPVLRAVVRLLSYVLAARREIRGARVVHIMANSGWAWHLFVLPVARLALARRVPLIINYRGGLADEFLSQGPNHVRRLLARADLRVTPSAFLQRVFAKHGLSAEIIPNIIDLSRFKAKSPASATSAPVLLVARNLEPIYDNATAIRAFARVRERFPAARLIVAGEGPEREALLQLCEQLQIMAAVEFAGRVNNADMPALYQRADLALNASTVDNMPISILEAFASGVPVVSTDAGGIPDLLEHGRTGLLVPIGDSEAMAAAALSLLSDLPLAQSFSAAAHLEAQRYAWSAVKPLWLAAYAKAGRPSAAPIVLASVRGD
ncbi:glycosyltransferase [Roseateles sp.]|uniref:glycosyltransferase n=1 Tax=Roseateles sp. TaxID=1971397 RepID=UPI003D11A6E7